jgi:hypothetical protein
MISSAWAAAGVAFGLALAPFGPLDKLVKPNQSWHGMDQDGPVFLLVRATRVPGGSISCSRWTHALEGFELGSRFEASAPSRFPAWEPWDDDDSEELEDCKRTPCKVKLDPAEAQALGARAKSQRYIQFLTLVTQRAQRYLSSEERPGYENGKSLEPWAELKSRGFKSLNQAVPKKAELWQRRLDFHVAPMKPIRQILDKRVAISPLSGDLWIRDVYTAHYFDTWGERLHVQCDPESHEVWVVHALLVDFDLMKKTDLLSRIARPRMKRAMQDLGYQYLDRSFERLKAQLGSTSAKSRPEMPSK